MQTKVEITNNRGLKLSGIFHAPGRDGSYPFVILLHGFTGYKEEKHIEELAKYLETQGIASLRFDASGGGESGGDMAHDYRVTYYLSDIERMYEHAKCHLPVDADHMGVWGQSMGGMMAILFTEKNPELTTVSVVAPSGDLQKSLWLSPLLDTWQQSGWLTKTSSKTGTQLRIPWAFIEDQRRYDVFDVLQRVHQPIQFIVGLSEDTIRPEYVREQFQAAHDPKELVEIPGMSHDYKKFPDQIYVVNNHVMQFLRKYL